MVRLAPLGKMVSVVSREHWEATNLMQILKAGVLYFALVFGAGFVLGTIRTLWVAPRVGTRLSRTDGSTDHVLGHHFGCAVDSSAAAAAY